MDTKYSDLQYLHTVSKMNGGLLMLFVGIFLTTNVMMVMEAALGEAQTNSTVKGRKTSIRIPQISMNDVPTLEVWDLFATFY